MKKIIFILLPIFAVVFLLTVYNLNGENETVKPTKTVRKVKVVVPEVVDYQAEIFAVGKLASSEEIKLSFKTGGIIKRIFVKEGQQIRKGQLLAELNLDEINARTQQAQTGAQQAQITIDNAKLAVNIAERDYRNAKGLFQDSVATLEQLENAELQLNSARNQLEAAETNLTFSQQNVDIATFNQSHSKIIAPSNGVILMKFSASNELVGPGNPVFLFGSQNKAQVVRVNVTDKDIIHINLGDPATIEFDAYPNQPFQGIVRQVASMADPFINTYEVEIEVKNGGKKLLSGFIGKVNILTKERQSLLRIPFDALISADKMKGEIFTVTDDQAEKRIVDIFKIENTNLLIKNGLAPNESVVIKGGGYLQDGDPIEIE